MSNRQPPATRQACGRLSRYAWLPIPFLITVMTILWIEDLRIVWFVPVLNGLLHYGSATLGAVIIVLAAGRSFLATGQPSVLMLGCGVLLMVIGGAATPAGISRSTSTGIAIYTTSALLSALCHFIGVAITTRSRIRLSHSAVWLTAACAGSMAVMGLIIWLALTDRMPLFFIDGQEGTPLRSLVISVTVALFLLTAGLLWRTNRRTPSPFLSWYALGLVLVAAGLAGSLVIAVRDSPLQWVTRFTRILGLGYMCVAVLASARENSTKGFPLTAVEEAWQAKVLLADFQQQTFGEWVRHYGLTGVAVTAAMGLRLGLEAWIGPGLPAYITFYPAVMAVAMVAGFAPGIVATLLTCVAVNLWVLPPIGRFDIEAPIDRMGLVIFAGMGLGMSLIAEFYRRNREKAAAYDREVALRDTKTRLAMFAEATFEGIAESNAGRIVDCNEQLAQMLGYPVAELRGMEIADCIAPEDRDRVMANFRQGLESVIEYTMLRRDGTPIVVEAHGRVGSPGSTMRYTAIRDITGRKQTEQALLRAKEEWERTFDSVPDLITLLDERYRIVRTNRAMAARLGRTPKECIGLACYTCMHDLDAPAAFCPHAQTLKNGGEHSAEVHNDRVDGDFLVTTTPLKDTNGRTVGTVHVARDITDQKRREAQLQKLNRTLKARTRSSEAMMRATEEIAYLREVCTIIVEDCGHAMVWIGYAEDDAARSVRPVAGAGFDPRYLEALKITWADTERGRGPTGTAIRTGRMSTCRNILTDPTVAPWREEALNRGHASAIAFPLLAEERCFGAISIYNSQPDPFTEEEVRLLTELADNLAYGITALRLRIERAGVEKALRVSEKQFKTLAEVSPSGIWQSDHRGRVQYVSGRWSEITGISPQEAAGSGWSKGVHPEDKERVLNEWIRETQAATAYQSEFRFVKPDGKVIWVLCIARLIEDAVDDRKSWVGAITDISALKRTEDNLSAALAEKEVLLREVHHRVKNNLAAIVGLMDMQRMILDDPQSRDALADLSRRIRSMSLVHEMLYRADSLTRINFQEYIQDLVALLRTSLCTPHISCRVDAQGMVIPLDFAVPCGMIINELITNALKYAFPEEKPGTGNDTCLIRVTMRHDHGTYTLSVADNGVGMPPGFDWTKSRTLGMILIRMLGQHQLGGSYELDQREGTRWTLTFTARKGEKNA